MLKEKDCTTMALERTLLRDLRKHKAHPRQSDNEVLWIVLRGYNHKKQQREK